MKINWDKATLEQVKAKCEQCIAEKNGLTVSPRWLWNLLCELERVRKDETFALTREARQ